ncbi:MAG: AbrB/MazE/SpoVT family DNA-binding domain-containing protein [Spirochaetia bacterium]|jgi:antitoxin MazE
MRAKLIPIGNSRGVRLPKPLIKEAGLEEEVDIHVRKGEIVISPVRKPREGWEKAARRARARKEDGLVDPVTPTHFEEGDWEW